ncbi:MAG: gliding motility-associated C-terminal domain-containing protein, partial [Ferruginibacter sp.]
STSVLVNPSPLGQVSFSIATICNGDSLQLIASGGQIYEWLPSLTVSSPNSPAPIASPTQTTAYIVKVSNQFMCADTASVVVTVLPKPTADAGPDRVIIAGNPIELEANATGSNLTYSWINGLFINDPDMLRPMVNPKVDTKYILIVSTDNGCGIAEDSVNVKVYSGVYIPNAFTPNGDNINDRWNIPALAAFKNFELLVFNRYGQIVFSNSRSIKPWDGKYKGKDVPVGVYTYYIDLKTGNAVGKLKGTVLVIR